MKKIISFICLLLGGATLCAQTQYTVKGFVHNASLEGIANVAIKVLDADTNVIVSEPITESNGLFSFSSAKRNLRIYIESTGDYLSYTGEPFLLNKNIELLSIPLASSLTLEEVVVTTTKRKSAVYMEQGKIVFSPKNSLTHQQGTALDALKSTPNVVVDNQNHLSIGGKSNVLVLINGKPTYMQPDDLANYLKSIPITQIKKTELLLNPPAEYEAQGGAGAVNIVLDKKTIEGTFLSLNNGVSYWWNLRQNTELQLQHSVKKGILHLGYNHQLGHYAMDYGSERVQNGLRYESPTDDTDKRKTIAGHIGYDYWLDQRHSLGAQLAANTLFGKGTTSTTTRFFNASNILEQTLSGYNDYSMQKANRYSANVYYTFAPSDNEHYQLDIDYAFFDGGSGNRQPNTYRSPAGAILSHETYLSENDRKIHIFATSFRSELPLWGGSLTAGTKYSQVFSDNSFQFFRQLPTYNLIDVNRSNAFDFKERIFAVYAQYHYPITERLSAEVGIRNETTFSKGQLLPEKGSTSTPQEHRKHYTNFFPTLNLQYQYSDNLQLFAGYSTRINRPEYQNLNPFEYLLDELSYWKGNPFLLPEKIQKATFSASYKKTSFTMAYSYSTDFFSSINEPFQANKIISIPKNIGEQHHLLFSLYQELNWGNGYQTTLTPNLSYIENKGAVIEGSTLHLHRWQYSLTMQNYFRLPYQLKGELTAVYNSRRLVGINEIAKSSGGIDIGLQRLFLNDRLTATFSFTDIFHTQRWDSESHLPNLDLYAYGNSESRQVKLNLTYQFGKAKEVHTSEVEEVERL